MEKKSQLDVFEYSIDAEKQGVNFYMKAAEKFDDPELKGLFKKLAKEEGVHIKTFVKFKEDAEKKGEIEPFNVEDIDDYLESIVHEGIFPRGKDAAQQLEGIDNPAAACALAMQAEKNAILLYSELARLSKSKNQKKVLEKMVKEEKSHMVMLRQVRANHDAEYAALAFGRFF